MYFWIQKFSLLFIIVSTYMCQYGRYFKTNHGNGLMYISILITISNWINRFRYQSDHINQNFDPINYIIIFNQKILIYPIFN